MIGYLIAMGSGALIANVLNKQEVSKSHLSKDEIEDREILSRTVSVTKEMFKLSIAAGTKAVNSVKKWRDKN